MADVAVSFAIKKLLPLLSDEANLLWGVPKEFADIEKELESIQGFMKDADKRAAEEGEHANVEIRKWVKELREASFRIEDIIDEYMMIYVEQQQTHDPGCAALLCQIIHFVETLMPRHKIALEIKEIKSVVDEIKHTSYRFQELNSYRRGGQSVQELSFPYYLDKAGVVGFESAREKLMTWLLGDGPKELSVISVVGMGGLGKTTLVGQVFNKKKIHYHFHIFVWITVSQSYTLEGLLRNLLMQLCQQLGEKPDFRYHHSDMARGSLIKEVRDCLEERRYVIIFDDVWDVEFWSLIEKAIPDNKNQSKIIITTRKKDVVESCKNSPFDKVYELKPLTYGQSMELFCMKAFKFDYNSCPPYLMNISSEIVKKCEGVPLAIVAIGDLLSCKEKTTFEWEKIRQSLSSEMEKNHLLIGITKSFGFSYDDLPYYLKSCLLYFGIYPEDYQVKSSRLIRQWIAEGFVRGEEGKTLEDVAQQYLTELIGRNLVQISSLTIDGKAKKCRVHNLLHCTILKKFKDLSFCQHISKEDKLMSNDEMIRRLSIATSSNDLMGSIGSSHTRSLLVFAGKESAITDNFLQRIPTKYRLLKVLDFEDGQLYSVPESWGNLAYLKYLSLRQTWLRCLPKFIGKLHNLETLDIRNTLVSEMPKEICKLKKLRHLLGNNMTLFQLKNDLGGMTSLQMLHQVKLSMDDYGVEQIKDDDVVELIRQLGKLKQLRNLGLTDVKEDQGNTLCSTINEMQNLEKLHVQSKEGEVIDLHAILSLPMLRKLCLDGKLNKFPKWIPQLQNLVKLSLRHSKLADDPLKSLENMPHLLFLYIGYQAYEGETLYFQDGGFKQLKELCLSYLLNLNLIIIDRRALGSLVKLELSGIPQLKTILPDLQILGNLQVLNIYDMSTEFNQCIAPDVRITANRPQEGLKAGITYHSRQ